MKKKPLLFCLAILINGLVLNAQVFNILPYPNKLEIGKGYFDLNTTIQIVNTIKDPMVTPTIGILKDHLKSLTQLNANNVKASFEISIDPAITNNEGYTLQVAPNKIVLKGNSPIGIFYGVQTFLQLTEQFKKSKRKLKVLEESQEQPSQQPPQTQEVNPPTVSLPKPITPVEFKKPCGCSKKR